MPFLFTPTTSEGNAPWMAVGGLSHTLQRVLDQGHSQASVGVGISLPLADNNQCVSQLQSSSAMPSTPQTSGVGGFFTNRGLSDHGNVVLLIRAEVASSRTS